VRYFIGIDPGSVSGAIALIASDPIIEPEWIALKNTYHDISDWLAERLERIRIDPGIADAPKNDVFAVMEKVHSMPRQGIASAFSFGENSGFCKCLLTVYKIPYLLVTPRKWETEMQCLSGGNKNITKAAAQRLYPGLKITHGNADALLLARYAAKVY
jgi:crossover junction endodeoxyribonuclease RuvC